MASKVLNLLNKKQNVPNLNSLSKVLEPVTYNNPYASKKKKAPVELTESYGVDNTPNIVDTPALQPPVQQEAAKIKQDVSSGKISKAVGNKRLKGLSKNAINFYSGFSKYAKDKYNVNVGISSGARTQDEQNKLYEQGRTTPGNIVTWTRNSKHIGGNAFDLVDPDKYYDIGNNNSKIARYAREYANTYPGYGATFLSLNKDPMHVQF